MSSSSWLCGECGCWFIWVLKEGETKPPQCPNCGASKDKIDSTEG